MLKLRDKADIFFHGVVGEESGFLNDPADRSSQLNRVAGSRAPPVDNDLTTCGREQAVDEFESRGLARAAASEQNQSIPGRYRKADVREQLLITDFVRDLAELNHGC